MKNVPSKDWDFDKETQSRILMMLDVISCQLSNMFKKKGAKPRKPAEQFQPDYVKEAKKEVGNKKNEQNENIQKDLAQIFEARNNQIKTLEVKSEQNRDLLQRTDTPRHHEGPRNKQHGATDNDGASEPSKG